MADANKSTHNNKNPELSKTEIAKIENSKISKVQKENEIIAVLRKKRLESMTEEEIIEENLKAILEKKSQEERKANGRLIAVLVAFLVIFLAIYHAWIRKTAVLAGVLVPAAIMLGYGGWVVVLAKRDKRKRAMFEKHIEEVAQKNKNELEKKAMAKQSKSDENASTTATLHFENEILKKEMPQNKAERSGKSAQTVTVQIEDHRKQRKRQKRDKKMSLATQMMNDGRVRKPSIRQKLFRQTPTENLDINSKLLQMNEAPIHEKRKRLQHMATLPLPQIVRMSSAP